MGLRIPDRWIWDFWFTQVGPDYHLFYLQAPRDLGEESLRHWHVSIGHAVSSDLCRWEILPDALGPSPEETAWDNCTTWTGSVLEEKGTWYMFYTGTRRDEQGLVQRIGAATSQDLTHWKKHPRPLLTADPTWYETLDAALWHDQAWRDPWVFKRGETYHALITARRNHGSKFRRGTIGHATSKDLFDWQVKPPLEVPALYGYYEVPQLIEMADRWYLIFSVTKEHTAQDPTLSRAVSGTHYLAADQPLGPYRLLEDQFLAGDSLGSRYSGKILPGPGGEWVFLACRAYQPDGGFRGEITDPLPLDLRSDGTLRLTAS